MKEQLVSVAKGAAIAVTGASLCYLTHWAAGQEFGFFTPLVVAGLSVLVNVVRKTAVRKKAEA